MRLWRSLTCLLVLTVGCGGSGSDAPARYDGPGQTVKVMTRNVYFGADLDSALNVSKPEQIPAAVASIWDQVQKSDFPGRARLIAQEIAATLPDIVAFQELAWFRMQSPSDFVPGAAPNAELSAPNGDMLAIMKDALAAAGLDYGEPVAVAPHTDTELPALDAQGNTFDLRMTDRDAVFVRPGVVADNPRGEDFSHFFTVPVGGAGSGISVKLTRGFAAVDLSVQGVPFTFVNAHLEVGGIFSSLQESQAKDLVERLSPIEGQIVLAGDFNSAADGSTTGSFNSAADGSTTGSYKTLTAEFNDAWLEVYPGRYSGPTCCIDIRNPASLPMERIDLILERGKVRAESATNTGGSVFQHTDSGLLLASDHLGVVASLIIGQ